MGNTLLPAPRKTVFHANRSTQEKEHGKRKRSLGCARDDNTRIPLPRIRRSYPFLHWFINPFLRRSLTL